MKNQYRQKYSPSYHPPLYFASLMVFSKKVKIFTGLRKAVTGQEPEGKNLPCQSRFLSQCKITMQFFVWVKVFQVASSIVCSVNVSSS